MMSSAPQGFPAGRVGDHNDLAIYLTILKGHQRERQPSTIELGGARATAGSPPDLEAFRATSDRLSGDFASSAMMQPPPASATAAAPAAASSYRRKPNFAEKLHAVLCGGKCRDAIAWLPSGNSFCVLDKEEFVSKILPEHFSGGKFDSFCRRLKRWGFRKVYADDGGRAVVFSHGLFHRDKPALCKMMNGVVKSADAVSHHDETVVAGGMLNVGGGDISACASRGTFSSHSVAFQRQLQQEAATQNWMDRQQAAAAFGAPRERTRGYSPVSLQGSVLSARAFSSLPCEGIDAAQAPTAIGTNAQATTPDVRALEQAMPQGCLDYSQAARTQLARLTRLNEGIADCDEQMAVLERMKESIGKPASSLPINDFKAPEADAAVCHHARATMTDRSVPNNARCGLEQDRRAMVYQDPGLACSQDYPHTLQDTQILEAQKIKLNHLNDDIANCEEQLVILQRMKELQEQKHRLKGTNGLPSGTFPRA